MSLYLKVIPDGRTPVLSYLAVAYISKGPLENLKQPRHPNVGHLGHGPLARFFCVCYLILIRSQTTQYVIGIVHF